MAKVTNTAAVALILSLLLIFSIVEARHFGDATALAKAAPAPECDAVIGVESGNTCTEIIQVLKLSANDFTALNPNLNCDALFVGQWLCVAGKA